MGPANRFFIACTALSSPWRSRAASPGRGGPKERSCRKGRSQRSTATPASAKAPARANRNGALPFDPAPWVRTSAGPDGLREGCRKPRTGGSEARSRNGSASDTGTSRLWKDCQSFATGTAHKWPANSVILSEGASPSRRTPCLLNRAQASKGILTVAAEPLRLVRRENALRSLCPCTPARDPSTPRLPRFACPPLRSGGQILVMPQSGTSSRAS